MAGFFAKVASDLHANPKIRRAGRNAREVFEHMLRINAGAGATGAIDVAHLDPDHLAYELQMPLEDARDGVERCLVTFIPAKGPLLRLEGEIAVIVGWDDEEWGRGTSSMTERDRKAQQRARQRAPKPGVETPPDVSGQSGQPAARPVDVQTSGPSEERRGEETSSLSLTGEGQTPRAVLTHSIGKLNEHRARLRPKAPPIRGLTVFTSPESPEGKALDVIARVPPEERQRDAERAIEVLAFQVEHEGRDFGDLRPGYLFGRSAFDALLAAWPPTPRAARAGPGGRSRGSAPPSTHHGTDVIDPKDIQP